MTTAAEMIASEECQDRIVARAAEIVIAALQSHDGNTFDALAELVGSTDVADLYVCEWGGETLALNRRAVELAGKEIS